MNSENKLLKREIIRPRKPLIDDCRMVTPVKPLKPQNPIEQKGPEKELIPVKIGAKPNLEQLVSKPNADLSAIRMLGMINGPGIIAGPGIMPYHPLQPRGLAADHRFVAEMEEKLRKTTDPRIRKEITKVLEKLK